MSDTVVNRILSRMQIEALVSAGYVIERRTRTLPGSEVLDVIRAVTVVTGAGQAEIVGSRRHRSAVEPRHIAMALVYERGKASLAEIGRAFGGRDHSTVFNAIERIEGKCAHDVDFAKRVDDARQIAARFTAERIQATRKAPQS